MLNGENGNGMVMPVAPMGYGYGGGFPVYSGGFSGNGIGDGNNGWWIILLLLALGGRGGWGNGLGGGCSDGTLPYLLNTNTQNDVNRGFDNAGLSSQISAVHTSVNDVNTGNQLQGILSAVNTGFSNAEVANCNRAFNQMQASYQNQIASLQNSFNLATEVDNRLDNLSMSLQKCCCDNELAISQTQNLISREAAENRFQAANNTRDIVTNATANTQAILDKLCQLELDGVRAERDNLRTQLATANQAAQTAALMRDNAAQTAALQADNAQQTANLIQRIAPYPVPAYPVGNPYGYYYNDGYNGCGCNYGYNNGVA